MTNLPSNDPVSVIITVYNEADTLENEILNIHNKILSKLPGSELIIAEDGSTDGTQEIISKYVRDGGVIHSTAAQRKGYAKALNDAMKIAKNPYIFFSDTGSKFDFDDFWKLYGIRDKYSLIIGVRSKRSDKLYRRFLTLAYNFVLKKYFNIYLEDSDSGFRIYKNALINKICNEEWVNTSLIGSELTLRTIFSGGNVGYAAVTYKQRAGVSRGLPPQKIFEVIIDVLKNFPELKRVLSSVTYPKLIR
ncbi:MAG: glycosyltransferase family 2 protein [Syntrophaceae bacterium]|nr:glycosyltransferase family 2 protein [Syntrophaceae bacterium]